MRAARQVLAARSAVTERWHPDRCARERHRDRDRVLEGSLREDLARPYALFEHRYHRATRVVGDVVSTPVDRWRRGTGRKREPQRLADGGHGADNQTAAT